MQRYSKKIAYIHLILYICSVQVQIVTFMTKEELLTRLTTKLGKTSLSQRTLNEYAEKVSATVKDDSIVTDEFVAMHASILATMQGQLSHDIAEAIESWKASHNAEPQLEPVAESANNSQIDDIKTLLTKMQADNDALRERLDNAEKRQNQNAYKQSLFEELRKNGANNEFLLKQTFASKSFDVDTPVSQIVEESLKEYDANYSACFGSGAAPRNVVGGDNHSADSKVLDKFFSQKVSEGKFPKED